MGMESLANGTVTKAILLVRMRTARSLCILGSSRCKLQKPNRKSKSVKTGH